MQKNFVDTEFVTVTPTAAIKVDRHGGRAKCLQRLVRLDMPVPKTVAMPFETVRRIAAGHMPDIATLLLEFGDAPLVSVRPSSQDPDWGGPGAVLNIGLNDETHNHLARRIGERAADQLYLRFVKRYAVDVARLDPDLFEDLEAGQPAIKRALAAYEDEMEEAFPQSAAVQLGEVLQSMARAWEGTTARLLRQAKGAPADAGLGLIVQEMVIGAGPGESGTGLIHFADAQTGLPQITGRYGRQAVGRDAVGTDDQALFLVKDSRGASLQASCPDLFDRLVALGEVGRKRLREEMQMEFAIENGVLRILDSVRLARSSRAAVRIAVDLARDGVITQSDALLRIEPRALNELLHPQLDPKGAQDVIGTGIAASPGAATGRIVFTSAAAQASAAQGEPCVLVRKETTPEDIRGMHAASAVLTERGGITSHAAVIARGLGLPCVVGVSGLRLNHKEKTVHTGDGRVFQAGDVITVDGSNGIALSGSAPMLDAALDDAFLSLLGWAEEAADIGVRANADTPHDAQNAARFNADGIGLCRTEHMFFQDDRLTVVREMIFADTSEDRAAALEQLLPMQRQDFVKVFQYMQGKPVCIRLFDPPLHEFLPHSREGMRELADALDISMSDVTRRMDELAEFNPMLGMRGVRLGITVPEIYKMQARALFEATIEASRQGAPVAPEIMIPLVSAMREVELVKSWVDGVAAEVKTETGAEFDYRLGVMVETPRAALRAGDIANYAAFMSFGTNDLTQMTYGLSRDDAGRFMGSYVKQQVFPEDPFHTLDVDGVGELLLIGAERGRQTRQDMTLSICGEHGGNSESIAFCRDAGFDYVSCSSFRVPIARLAAAQLALREERAKMHQNT